MVLFCPFYWTAPHTYTRKGNFHSHGYSLSQLSRHVFSGSKCRLQFSIVVSIYSPAGSWWFLTSCILWVVILSNYLVLWFDFPWVLMRLSTFDEHVKLMGHLCILFRRKWFGGVLYIVWIWVIVILLNFPSWILIDFFLLITKEVTFELMFEDDE